MKYLLILLVAVICSGCMFEREIDPEIEIYVDKFYYEARTRGLHLARPNMKIVFKDIKGSAQGRCNMVFKTIYIDRNSSGWQHNPEALIFHELGHLILGRDHYNKTLNKYPLSIMSNQDDPVYDYHDGDKLYNRRQYYIDELFDSKTPAPDWMQ